MPAHQGFHACWPFLEHMGVLVYPFLCHFTFSGALWMPTCAFCGHVVVRPCPVAAFWQFSWKIQKSCSKQWSNEQRLIQKCCNIQPQWLSQGMSCYGQCSCGSHIRNCEKNGPQVQSSIWMRISTASTISSWRTRNTPTESAQGNCATWKITCKDSTTGIPNRNFRKWRKKGKNKQLSALRKYIGNHTSDKLTKSKQNPYGATHKVTFQGQPFEKWIHPKRKVGNQGWPGHWPQWLMGATTQDTDR